MTDYLYALSDNETVRLHYLDLSDAGSPILLAGFLPSIHEPNNDKFRLVPEVESVFLGCDAEGPATDTNDGRLMLKSIHLYA